MIRRHALVVLVAAALACAGPRAKAPAAAAPVAAPAAPAAPAGPDRTHVPPLGPAPVLALPAQHHFALANGLKVRLVEYRRLPVVAMNLLVGAGGGRDPARLPGLASFTAAMLTEGGTRTRSAIQLSDETNFLGASIHASAGPDSAAVSGAVLAKHLAKYLELFADVTANPAFPRGDFDRVQDQRLVALLQQRDQPQPMASKTFIPVFWGKMPYGHYLLGDEASVKATRPRDLAEFHARYYRPENAELVVVGDVSEAELRPLLDATLGRWKRGATPLPLAPTPPAAPHRTIVVDKPDAPQTYVLLGMPGVPRSSPDFVAASVAFQVLGGGSSSRLFRNLREEKGYTYGVYAMGDARKLAGVSLVAGSVRADVTGPALKEILRELDRLREEPVPAQELSDAKDALVLGLPADFATAGGIAARVAELALHGLPDDYWNRYADAVRKVDAEAVRRIAQRYLDPARMTVVMVANPSVVRPQLAGLPLGPIDERPSPAPAKVARPARAAGAR